MTTEKCYLYHSHGPRSLSPSFSHLAFLLTVPPGFRSLPTGWVGLDLIGIHGTIFSNKRDVDIGRVLYKYSPDAESSNDRWLSPLRGP